MGLKVNQTNDLDKLFDSFAKEPQKIKKEEEVASQTANQAVDKPQKQEK